MISLRGGLAIVVFLLIAGCGAPASDVPTNASPSPTSTPTTTETQVATDTTGQTGTVLGSPSETERTSPSISARNGGEETPSTTYQPTQSPAPTPTVTASPATTATPTSSATPTQTSNSTPTQTATASQKSQWEVTVVRVIDGDTFEVRFPDGHNEDVRLLGVDTPEVHTENDPSEFEGIPDNEEGRQWLRDWGHKASEFARTRVGGEEITIETDDEADRRGSYGRLLVYAYDDQGLFNEHLIEQGYARMYESSFSKRPEFEADEANAQENDIGVWGFESRQTATPTPTPVPDGGSSGSLEVVRVHADAEGNDHENENDEYVVFRNPTDSAVNLEGWQVSDEADHTYTFPDVTVGAGEEITLYTGPGQDSSSAVYWGSDSAIWNNDGDTVYVRDSSGALVEEYSYSG